MKRLLKWIGIPLAGLLLLAAGFLGIAWLHAARSAATVYAIGDPPLPELPDDALARGAHLYETRGCSDCHGSDGRGREVLDAGPFGSMVATNITPPSLGERGYDAQAIAAAVRHGVRADGTPLLFMPAGDWRDMSDADVAALAAHVQSLPPQAHDPGRSALRPLGWVLHLLGKAEPFPAETLDHAPRARSAPEVAASAEYGEYLAQACTGCHGPALKGGIQFAPHLPVSVDLGPARLGKWNEADFLRAMRQGKRPDDSAIDPFMPWQSMGKMSDVELRALWAYLRTLPGN